MDITEKSQRMKKKIDTTLKVIVAPEDNGDLDTQPDLPINKDICNQLFQCIYDTDLEGVRRLLPKMNASEINSGDKNQYTPLIAATSMKIGSGEADEDRIIHAHDEIVREILNFRGINVTLTNSDGNTALHYFCQNTKTLSLFNLFFAKGAQINARNNRGETPIFKAIYNRKLALVLIDLLKDYGADTTVATNVEENLLHHAVRMANSEMVSALLESGVPTDLKSKLDSLTPFEVALKFKIHHVAKLLAEHQGIEYSTEDSSNIHRFSSLTTTPLPPSSSSTSSTPLPPQTMTGTGSGPVLVRESTVTRIGKTFSGSLKNTKKEGFEKANIDPNNDKKGRRRSTIKIFLKERIKLTEDDKKMILESYKAATSEMEEDIEERQQSGAHGSKLGEFNDLFWKRLFQLKQETQKLFPNVYKQTRFLTKLISSLINNLDLSSEDLRELVLDKLDILADDELLNFIEISFLYAIENMLGEDYSHEIWTVWRKLFSKLRPS